jgi:polyhydroxybutyrate depolymerase
MTPLRLLAWSLAFCLLGAGCKHERGAPAQPIDLSQATRRDLRKPTTFGGERPVSLRLPRDYDGSRPLPLLIALHGFGADADHVRALLDLDGLLEGHDVLFAAPQGTPNARGDRFWNATPACCAFGETVDDVAYLAALIAEIERAYRVDPARRFVIGHSNGGFMAYRLACERADLIAAVVSVGGATFVDPTACRPSRLVSVLQVHGDQDTLVAVDGGKLPFGDGHAYPGVEQTLRAWAGYYVCEGDLVCLAGRDDLDAKVAGSETLASAYSGCPSGVGVELWRLRGSGHFPDFGSGRFARQLWDWLASHAR